MADVFQSSQAFTSIPRRSSPPTGYCRLSAYTEPCEAYCILWCLVEGDYKPFKVTPPLNFDIDNLKEVIHAKGIDTTKFSVLPKDLVLWKLRESEPLEPDDTFIHRVSTKLSNLSEVATELGPWKKLSVLFPQQPPKDCLHILIQMSLNPAASQKRAIPTAADSNDYPSKRPRNSSMVLDENLLSHALLPTVPYAGRHSEEFLKLTCLECGDDVQNIFTVQLEASKTVMALKYAIKEMKEPAFQYANANTFDVWSVSLPIDDDFQEKVGMAGKPLSPEKKLSTVFLEPPALNHIHIIVKVPAIVPGDGAGPWLTEIQAKIWNGGNKCLKKLVYKATVTVAHYHELQKRLAELRNVGSGSDEKISSIKHNILLWYKPDPNTSGNAQISANVIGDQELEPNEVSDDDDNDDNDNDDNDNDNDDQELASFLPTTFEFLDLSSLRLTHELLRLPLPLFIRSEYNIIYEEIRRDVKRNSHMVSGQPGTGKTAFLHFMMIKYMIFGLPFLYQSIDENVYHVSFNGVRIIKSWEPRKNIVAFVDADTMGDKNVPKAFLYHPCVQFIMASSPKGTEQKWTKQVGVNMFKRIANLWTPCEFYVTGIFLHPRNLDLKSLRESTSCFGFNPRTSFNACKSGLPLDYHQANIIAAIKSIKPSDVSLQALMDGTIGGTSNSLSHVVFQILPSNEKCYFSQAQVQAVSSWVLEQLLEYYEVYDTNAAANFYEMTRAIPRAGPLRGEMFELRVLRYFDNIHRPMVFKIRNLATSESLDWTYPGPAPRKTFQSQFLPVIFKEFVEKKEARHMVPLIPNFAAVDSILYDPASVLTGFQITINQDHPVAISGFRLIQKSLKRNSTKLTDLRPKPARRWRLIFVVPESMAADFPRQKFEGDSAAGNWAQKVDQYVLGLEKNEVWRKYLAK